MAVDIASTLLKKWPVFVNNGLTNLSTFQSMEESSYTPGNDVSTPVSSSHSIEIIFDNIQASLVDESTVRSIDRYAIFPVLLLPVVPKLNDLIVDSSLVVWTVKAINTDPANAHYQLHVRPRLWEQQ